MFALRKILETLTSPFALAYVAMVGGMLLGLHRSDVWKRRAHRLLVAGAIGVVLLACGLPFDPIAGALERRYPPIQASAIADGVQWIVVLGGGVQSRSGLSVSAVPSASSVARIAEGVRLQKAFPNSRLIFTGFAAGGVTSAAAAGQALALALGVDADHIRVEDQPRTTADEALRVREIVGSDRVVLVTSALHMPRAMRLFRKAGVSPVPAPTDYRAQSARPGLLDWIVPSPQRIALAGDTWHELLGMAAGR